MGRATLVSATRAGARATCSRFSRPCSQDAAIAKVGHDLKFATVILAREDVDACRHRPRHDARRVSAGCVTVEPGPRAGRARTARLQGADGRRRAREGREGRAVLVPAARCRPQLRRRTRGPVLAVGGALRAGCSRPPVSRACTAELELPLVPILAGLERIGVRVDTRALAGQATHLEQRARHTRHARSTGRPARRSTSDRPSSWAMCSSKSSSCRCSSARARRARRRRPWKCSRSSRSRTICRGSFSNGEACRS